MLADDILTAGEGQLKALLVTAGNPLLTCANTARLTKAFKQLELLVAIDVQESETALYADYLLPGSHWLERADIPFTFNSLMGTTPIPYHQYTDPILPLKGNAKEETWIYLELCRYAGVAMGGSRILQGLFALGRAFKKLPLVGDKLPGHTVFILGLINRFSGFGSLAKLRRGVNGVARPAIEAGSFIGHRVATPDGKIQLAPTDFCQQLGDLEMDFDKEISIAGKLKLISKRERYSHNSWTHNHPTFVKGKNNRNHLNMSVHDANLRGLQDGQLVEVFNEQGTIQVALEVTDDMMPGSLSLCHGWGHQQVDALKVASKTQGVNVNVLARDGLVSMEPISGMSQLNGIVVDVKSVTH
ncbi:molybdopterin dinucleotide binding domain-containing protein [Oceanicoccus sp. KOV_DT_Chl]|uniref:molybdopterin dinucleotide binding domain-containing protein n=1 Tax=Oceanicoccus sp. KOV_DT_Chl TaxID=1904639 RepID=UPI000C7E3EF2|nr:molybdopterin dinucleotide binding domain-containing protein [Oceanicoccus sp. KOV_DT_Chl]